MDAQRILAIPEDVDTIASELKAMSSAWHRRTGATPLDAGDFWVPLVVAESVSIFPGIPELLLGCYPRMRKESYPVMPRLEPRHADYLQRALDSLPARLPAYASYDVEQAGAAGGAAGARSRRAAGEETTGP